MALPWVRLDTQFPSNPKVLALAEDKNWRAIVAYVSGLGYAGAHGTDGFLPKSCLPYVHATTKDAMALCVAGLWAPVGAGGWQINGWSEFQPSNAETAARSARAKAAAETRWHGKRQEP